ncbi:MAG: hypothetical protein KDE34_19845, partial [Anaerolineales bacterium]|nr:hypothetical protein [Anaerolineales bacterium]
MTATITLNDKIRVRRDVESRKHRLGQFTEQGAVCERCRGHVFFVNGRIELDEKLTAVCAAVQYTFKDAPPVTAV